MTGDAGTPLHVLALNSGSSSLKFGLYRCGTDAAELLAGGEVEAIGSDRARWVARDRDGHACESGDSDARDHGAAVAQIGTYLAAAHLPAPDAIGHRVVHGGPTLLAHCLIDQPVLHTLQDAAAFAPLHAPPALDVIGYARAHFPDRPQVACLDTVFHATLPDVARTLPLPRALRDQGLHRYGFHGLSCESIVDQLDAVPSRVVIAHLGNGSSITAVSDGRSVDTSMGLTPTGGVPMGTRTGDIDPGVLVWLMRTRGLDADRLEDLVDRQSGLFGLSGIGADMRRLHEAAASDDDARLAIAVFVRAVQKQVAGMIAVLGGIDLLVFTGGIGEHDAQVRDAVCTGLPWLRDRGDVPVRVLPSQEEAVIARHTARLVAG